jgi:HEAT repeat protein
MGETAIDDVLRDLVDGDLDARRRGLSDVESACVPLATDVVEALVNLLGDESKELRRRAAGVLVGACDDSRLRSLIDAALQSHDPDTRWGAAFVLAQASYADDRVFAAACDAMGGTDGDVRWSASRIVVDYAAANPHAERALRALTAHDNADARKMALYCLRDMGCAQAGVFVPALQDEDAGVRLAALAGLARTGTVERPVLACIEACMVEDAIGGVRRAAAVTLGAVAGDDAESRRRLEQAAGGPDADLARAARAALGRLV